MKFEEKTLSSECIYKGKVIDVYRDEVEIADGHRSFREVVKHSGGVVILAIKNDGLMLEEPVILMVKQYRYPIGKAVYELPAGKLEKGENPDLACKRELEEETGYRAKKWKSLGYINTSQGFCNEKLYLYCATDLEYIGVHPDDGEIIQAYEFKLKEAAAMISKGEINDAKTICAIYRTFFGAGKL